MRRFSLVSCAALSLAPPLSAQVPAPTVVVGVGSELSALKAEPFQVPIFADMRGAPGHRLGSYTIRIAWDPAVLVYEGIEAGAFAQPQAQTDSIFYGVLVVAGVSAAGQDGVVDLVRLKMHSFTLGSSAVSLQVTELSAAVSLADLLTATTVAVVNGSFCAAVGRWGDLDNDSLSNSRDALAILSSVVGLPLAAGFTVSLGDVDGDGKVNSRDALIILSYAVGLDIPGQRVLVPAPGTCGTGAQPTLAIVPDTVDLVVGQPVRAIVQARTTTGTLVGLDANWQVADPTIAQVDPTGLVTGRAAGTTNLRAALGPGIRVSGPVVVRARRPVWLVSAAAAKRAPVQLGTPRWPLATPQRAFPHLREGDTVRVLPGLHDYELFDEQFDYETLDEVLGVGAVIIGDTLPDGTRPVLRAPSQNFLYGFDWRGGGRGEVRNLTLRGFYIGVLVNGVRTLTLDNVRIENPTTTFGYGVYVQNRVDTLRVLRSELLSDLSRQSSYGIYVSSGASLVLIQNSTIRNWGGQGLYGFNVDSLDVSGSVFANNGGGLLLVYPFNELAQVGARLSRNRFEANLGGAIYIDGVRRAALDHNFIFQTTGNAVQMYGRTPVAAGSRVTLQGDSIKARAGGWYWGYLADVDSVLVDSLWLEHPADTLVSTFSYLRPRYLRVTRSKLLNIAATGIDFAGRRLVVETSEFTGCRALSFSCSWTGVPGINATRVANDSGPAVEIRNSTFFHLGLGLNMSANNDSAGPVVIANNTVDSVGTGFQISGDSVVMTDNVFTRIGTRAAYVVPTFTARPLRSGRFLRNQIRCSLAGSTFKLGVEAFNLPVHVEDNGIRDCRYGVYVSNSATYGTALVNVLRDTIVMPTGGFYGVYLLSGPFQPRISGNRIQGGTYGVYLPTFSTPSLVLDSNEISRTTNAGIYLAPSGTVTVTGVGNNISLNVLDGILSSATGTVSFTNGRFRGNGRWAVSSSLALDASDNWWGKAAGAGGPPPGTRSTPETADSVRTTAVNVSSPKALDPGADPPLLASPALAGPMGPAGGVGGARDVPAPEPPPAPGAAPSEDRDAIRAGQQAAEEAAQAARQAAEAQVRAEAERWRAVHRPRRVGSDPGVR